MIKDIQVQENLDEYFHSLKDNDIHWSVAENEYFRDVFGLQISFKVNEKMMERAAKKKVAERAIQGVHTYDMLKNPIYANHFEYVSAFVQTGCKRENLIIDGTARKGHNTCA